MGGRNSNELPWIARALMVIGLVVGLLVFFNVWSGGTLLRFFEAATAVSTESSSPADIAPEPVFEAPSETEIDEAMRAPWDCYYEPSFNEDWHDDVVCVDGVESFRPRLLPESGFVTEDEMRAAGEAYEVELNAGP
ncbi:hypothetical protein GCM10022381_12810 [Leifsonia kafniensis]|uniref:Uncharacterized protein n=1 Tax=Leifsonia kafniensis TaxID=475957 RepID=A0ABP7KAG3_9MICO